MKQVQHRLCIEVLGVTPFAGVWIETGGWVGPRLLRDVTPFADVWIETTTARPWPVRPVITPFAGVWIETVESAATWCPA